MVDSDDLYGPMEVDTLMLANRIMPITAVVPISEVIPSRGVRALEGEGRGLSHLEVIARGRLWRQLPCRFYWD